MTVTSLDKTSLSVREKSDLAASAFALQGEHGAISQLAREFDVSRPTVYSSAKTARAVLQDFFDGGHNAYPVTVDDAQAKRAIVALRTCGVNSIRSIETLLPILYPGGRWSYGAIQLVLAGAENKAAARNAQDDLSAIEAAALDEMFSQGDPVLAGVDLRSGYLFALALRATRSGEDWAEVLGMGEQHQGLDLKIAVKDAGRGIAAGVSAVFPGAEQRDDCFHAIYEMGKVRLKLERRAYSAIASEQEAELALERRNGAGRAKRKSRAQLAAKLRFARERADKAMEIHDRFEQATRAAHESLEFADAVTGELRTGVEMQTRLEQAGRDMMALDHQDCTRVGKYIVNRAPGLALHAMAMAEELTALQSTYGEKAVAAACTAYRNACDLRDRKRAWDHTAQKQRLRAAIASLESLTEAPEHLWASVDYIIQNRNRASSAIEGFNAALRPHLYVHKGTTQEFLELFRFHYNRRQRRWGRHKGTSALEVLSGNEQGDWLTQLGYPPSPANKPTLH